LAALASGFVAVLALAASTYNVYLQRMQVRAQVWPRLVWGRDFDTGTGLTFSVENRGVGPAEVKRIRVLVDGTAASDWMDAERRLLRRNRVPFTSSTGFYTTISPNLSVVAFRLSDHTASRELVAQLDRLEVEICYCSTLGECWTLHERGLFDGPRGPETVDRCTPDPHPFKVIDGASLDELLRSSTGDEGDGGASPPDDDR
jgi:hypothetical protein